MDIWPKNYDTLKVLHMDDEISTEKTVRITIELLDPNSSEPLKSIERRAKRLSRT
jgi:hypothetical protein